MTVEHHDLNPKDLRNHLENVWNTKIRARKYARVGTWNRNPCRRLNDLRVNRTTRRPAQGIIITWSVTGDQEGRDRDMDKHTRSHHEKG